MKYLLRILLFTFLLIPFVIWESLVAVWTFRTNDLKELFSDYAETVEFNYRRAFPRRSKRSNTF
jgi:hypothetical protein